MFKTVLLIRINNTSQIVFHIQLCSGTYPRMDGGDTRGPRMSHYSRLVSICGGGIIIINNNRPNNNINVAGNSLRKNYN
jgi:hypothetical protein